MVVFDDVYQIMSDSFAIAEFRSYEGQKKLLERDDYTLKIYEKKGVILGFCSYYKLPNLYFIEHLACTPKSRGLGIGSQLIRDILHEAEVADCLVILEVEIPSEEVEKRRVQFYERLGFYLNPYFHYQPPLNSASEGIELKMMSFSKRLTEAEQLNVRRLLNKQVYLMEEDYKILL